MLGKEAVGIMNSCPELPVPSRVPSLVLSLVLSLSKGYRGSSEHTLPHVIPSELCERGIPMVNLLNPMNHRDSSRLSALRMTLIGLDYSCHPELNKVKRRISFSEFKSRSLPTTRFFAPRACPERSRRSAQNDINGC
jgi:hypothetical protein